MISIAATTVLSVLENRPADPCPLPEGPERSVEPDLAALP